MSIDRSRLNNLSNALVDIAERAGREILAVYGACFDVRTKRDATPVTEADERAEKLILKALAEIAPEIPVVAEESVAEGRVPEIKGSPFFLVDPLDGTKEFVSRNGEFTVNIALVENDAPLIGAIHVPVLEESYWCDGDGAAWRRRGARDAERIRCRKPNDGLVVVASRSHRDSKTDAFLQKFRIKEQISAGSSIKFCRVAEGAADLYPRLGRTMEWDVAAGHAIVNAAGGSVTTLDDEPFTYGKPDFANPFFVVRGLRPDSSDG
ncbi:MAG TPA: 3'(2'),5'-bisphosphate nucleotidase CysQ [Gammaproteobacteria bacterium]|nr:3'(2'),5'-bisphosphate nucleotidase CysQ [Gammaproteobacteria bacterium]